MIPEAAVEAAARGIFERHGARYYDPDVSWDDLQARDQASWLNDARRALEAAAPHMLTRAYTAGHLDGVIGAPNISPYR